MPYVCFSKIATDDLINKARELNNKYEDIEQKWFSFHILSFFNSPFEHNKVKIKR